MDTAKTEVLLIEMAGASEKNKMAWRHSISRSAPLGLYCLKAIAPERIGIIDVPVAQIVDNLSLYAKSPLKSVIFRLAEKPDSEKVLELLKSLREVFPNIKIGCNYTIADITKSFDFVINGSGKTSVLRILRGDSLSGLCDDLKNDLISFVDIPKEKFVDVGYDILPEKWLSVHNLEVWQPWLGLNEFSTSLFKNPGLDWITQFLTWLSDSGFNAFHLNVTQWTVEEINRLRSVIVHNNISLSLSILSIENLNYTDILVPLKRIWLVNPNASKAEDTLKKLKAIKEAGFEACLQIEQSWFGGGTTLSLCRYIDHLVIADDYLWSNRELKKMTQTFWGSRTRFFRKLFGLRTAAELIVFMKASYALIETLFLSDTKGEEK